MVYVVEVHTTEADVFFQIECRYLGVVSILLLLY